MKHKIISLFVCGFVIAIAEEAKLVIKNPSSYRTIDKTSDRCKLNGIPDIGIGNVLFSTHELPFRQEKTYTDLRDTFYFGKDTSLYCRAYFPGTLSSLVGIIKSQNPGVDLLEPWAELVLIAPGGDSSVYPREWPGPLGDKANWDQRDFNLFSTVGAGNQNFARLDLSTSPAKPGTCTIAVKLFLKFNIGAVMEFPTTTIKNFLVSYGKFTYIRQ
jgi:hypothetical protein